MSSLFNSEAFEQIPGQLSIDQVPRYDVELTERGFVVVDTRTDEIVRGAFSQRFKALILADSMNRGEA